MVDISLVMTAGLQDVRIVLAEDYEVECPLGRGGVATVYLAEDWKRGGTVAIKLLEPDLAGSVGHELYLREIRLASALTHPGIVTVQDSGEANGLLYMLGHGHALLADFGIAEQVNAGRAPAEGSRPPRRSHAPRHQTPTSRVPHPRRDAVLHWGLHRVADAKRSRQ